MTFPLFILHCPSLGRDLEPILARVPEAQIAEGPRLTDGYAGCTAGHQAIVRRAMTGGWPAVGIFEDDCAFTDAFSVAQWRADARWAAQRGYQAVIGGSVSTRGARLVRTGLYAVERFKSTHCVTYLRSAFETVLRVGAGPIDKQLSKLGLRTVLTVPFVAVQRIAFSGALHRIVDYGPQYIRHETTLRMGQP